MRKRTVRRPVRPLITVVLALLASGCGGHTAKPAATPSPSPQHQYQYQYQYTVPDHTSGDY